MSKTTGGNENSDESLDNSDHSQSKPLFRNIAKRLQIASRIARAKRNSIEEENDVVADDNELKYLQRKNSKKFLLKLPSKRRRALTLKQFSQISDDSTKNVFRRNASKISDKSVDDESEDEDEIICDGFIHFWKKSSFDEGHPYVKVNSKVDAESVTQIMHQCWLLDLPKIACFIISNGSSLIDWTNLRQIKNFQKGLIKAAISTNMWIFTNGLNNGIAYAVGNAVRSETIKMKSKRNLDKPNLTNLIGVMREDQLIYGETLGAHEKDHINIENEGINNGDKFELNPDHTHFIVLRDKSENNINLNLFTLRLIQLLTTADNPTNNESIINTASTPDSLENPVDSINSKEIPVVSILIEGDSDSARLVLDLIKNHVPVVVLRGSGGVADLIALAYVEMTNRCRDINYWDTEYAESHLKPVLSKKIMTWFAALRENSLARNLLRDRVIECVRLSKSDRSVYLTILNIYDSSCNLENLSEYLLLALLKSRNDHSMHSSEKFMKDLELTMDWNCADVAKNIIFAKSFNSISKVDKSKFESALIRPNREEFVDLFLTLGFQTHKFVSSVRLKRLFKLIHHNEFFHTICWESILGHSVHSTQSRNFIVKDLNWLIETCTGFENFVNVEHLNLNIMGLYPRDALSSERKTLTLLTFWAVLHNRHKLAEILWKHSDQAVHLALVISMIFERLSWYCADTNLKLELKSKSKKFADYANGILDACYREDASRAYDVLSETTSEWNYKTAVDIAANAQLRQFLAHPCCQKWLTNTFLGHIRLREINWGIFTIPPSIKILLCTYLIFPMYLWVHFKLKEEQSNVVFEEDIEDINDDMPFDPKPMPGKSNSLTNNDTIHATIDGYTNRGFVKAAESIATKLDKFKEKNGTIYRNYILDREVIVRKQPPLWSMVWLMWSAPITKFYNHQFFYIMFLALLSFHVLYSNCVHSSVNVIICVWTTVLIVNYIRRAYILWTKYTSVPLFYKSFEIVSMIVFVLVLIIPSGESNFNFYRAKKVILSIGLIYFYYRFTAIYLPISPSLGPLLHRLKLMITVDFVNFMRITLLVIVSNGIVIQAILYENSYISWETIRITFHRAFFSLFMAPVGELEPHPNCVQNDTIGYCTEESSCATSGFWSYAFMVQYFVFLKLILNALLLAIFAARAAKLSAQTDLIWKFQRYQLVIDFVHRLALPAPLSLFWYFYQIYLWFRRRFCGSKRKTKVDNTPENDTNIVENYKLSEDDCNYWRQLALDFIEKQESKQANEQLAKKEWECIQIISEDIEYEKNVLREIKNKINELEFAIYSDHSADSSLVSDRNSQTSAHPTALSRHSPYPGTRIIRVPVPDKHVEWEVMFIDYEPAAYSKIKSEFPQHMQQWVDEDIQLIKEIQLRNLDVKVKFPTFHWNSSVTNAAGLAINRMSWHINSDGSALIYKLEDNIIPRNPFGRTGLKGRGGYPRWGPNHYVMLAITRWRKHSQLEGGNRTIEFLFESMDSDDLILLPERFIPGDDLFGEIQQLFEADNHNKWVLPEMVKFFKMLAEEENQFSFELLKYGYLDDQMNTDNAWKEAKVWHIHYNCKDWTKRAIKSQLKWYLLSESLFTRKLSLGHAAIVKSIIDKMQVELI